MRHPEHVPPIAMGRFAFRRSYEGRAENVPLARGDLVDCLRAAGADEGLVEDVRLCVSEIAANAVRHAIPHHPEAAFVLIAHLVRHLGRPMLRLEVHDPAGVRVPDFPPLGAEPDFEKVSGRGLQLVDMVSENCGYGATLGGWKEVWAEFTPHGLIDDDSGAQGLLARAYAAVVADC